MDEKYLARCRKTLKEWGAPLDGWYCVSCYDCCEEPDDELFDCELCGCSAVRYVHVMRHDWYFEEVRVGCICAGIMEDDILAAKEREREVRNRSKRRKNFVRGGWRKMGYGIMRRTYKGRMLAIQKLQDGRYVVYCDGKLVASKYKGKKITDELSAAYAAFDAVDKEE